MRHGCQRYYRTFLGLLGLLFLLSSTSVWAQDSDNSFEDRLIGNKPRSSALPSANETAEQKPPTNSSVSTFRMVISLTAVLALIFAALYFLRRFSPSTRSYLKGRTIEVLARSSLNSRQSLCLVKLGRHLLLLGLSPNHIAVVDKIDQPEDISLIEGQLSASQNDSISHTFSSLFKQETRQYEKQQGLESTPSNDDLDDEPDQPDTEVRQLLNKVKGMRRMTNVDEPE